MAHIDQQESAMSAKEETRYGVLRIDFAALKDALHLPEDCEITAVRHFYDGSERAMADLVITSPRFPESPIHDLPLIAATVHLEVTGESSLMEGERSQ